MNTQQWQIMSAKFGAAKEKYSNIFSKRAYDKREKLKDSRMFFVGDARQIGAGTSHTRNVQGGNWAQPKMSSSYHPKILSTLSYLSLI